MNAIGFEVAPMLLLFKDAKFKVGETTYIYCNNEIICYDEVCNDIEKLKKVYGELLCKTRSIYNEEAALLCEKLYDCADPVLYTSSENVNVDERGNVCKYTYLPDDSLTRVYLFGTSYAITVTKDDEYYGIHVRKSGVCNVLTGATAKADYYPKICDIFEALKKDSLGGSCKRVFLDAYNYMVNEAFRQYSPWRAGGFPIKQVGYNYFILMSNLHKEEVDIEIARELCEYSYLGAEKISIKSEDWLLCVRNDQCKYLINEKYDFCMKVEILADREFLKMEIYAIWGNVAFRFISKPFL